MSRFVICCCFCLLSLWKLRELTAWELLEYFWHKRDICDMLLFCLLSLWKLREFTAWDATWEFLTQARHLWYAAVLPSFSVKAAWVYCLRATWVFLTQARHLWYAAVLPSFSVKAAWAYCLRATWVFLTQMRHLWYASVCLLSLWKLREFTAWELLEYFWHKWDICDMHLFCLLSLWKLREFTAWELLEYFWHKWDIFDMHLFCLLSLWKLLELTAWELLEIFLTQVRYLWYASVLPSFSVKAAWVYCLRATWTFLTQVRPLWYASVLPFFLCESCLSLLLESYLSISDTSEIFFHMLLFCLLSLWKLREFTAWELLEYFWHKWDMWDMLWYASVLPSFSAESCVSLLLESYLNISDTSETFVICTVLSLFSLCKLREFAAWEATWIFLTLARHLWYAFVVPCFRLWKLREFTAWELLEYFWHKWDICDMHLFCLLSLWKLREFYCLRATWVFLTQVRYVWYASVYFLSLWKLREFTAWELLEYFWHKWDICDMHLFCLLSLWKLREFTAWELLEYFWHTWDICDMRLFLSSFICESCVSLLLESYLSISDTSETFVICFCFVFLSLWKLREFTAWELLEYFWHKWDISDMLLLCLLPLWKLCEFTAWELLQYFWHKCDTFVICMLFCLSVSVKAAWVYCLRAYLSISDTSEIFVICMLFCLLSLWKLREFTAWELLEYFWHKWDIFDMHAVLLSFFVKAAWVYCFRATWVFPTQVRYFWYACCFAFFLCESCVSLLLESYLNISDTSFLCESCVITAWKLLEYFWHKWDIFCAAFFLCESCVSLLLESCLSISDTSEIFLICMLFCLLSLWKLQEFICLRATWVFLTLARYFVICICFAFFLCESCLSLLLESYLSMFWHMWDICDLAAVLPSFSVKAAWVYCLRATWVFLTQVIFWWYASALPSFSVKAAWVYCLRAAWVFLTHVRYVRYVWYASVLSSSSCESCVSLLLESYLSIFWHKWDKWDMLWYASVLPSFSVKAAWVYCFRATWVFPTQVRYFWYASVLHSFSVKAAWVCCLRAT